MAVCRLASITSISAGMNHTCGLDGSGNIYCWGGRLR